MFPYHFLSQCVVALHLTFVLFAVFGGLFLFWRRWFIWIHVPSAIWAVLTEWMGLTCPLTHLENWLRIKAGDVEYAGTFVMQYLYPILYLENLTRNVQVILGATALLANLAIYTGVLIFLKKKCAFQSIQKETEAGGH
jgi:hypothetical protein